MTEKKTLDESATLTMNTSDGGVDGSLTINANDEAELIQIIKRAGLDKTENQGSGPASLAITSLDGKISTNFNSPDIRSIMALLRVTDAAEVQNDPSVTMQPSDVGMDAPMAENAEVNDYAAELSSRKGAVYPGSDSRPGTARAPTVSVPAKSGDNPLKEHGLKSFKEYLGEFMEHVYPKKGDLRPVLYSKYRGEEYTGWGVEQYQVSGYGGQWDMPDWFHDEPNLAGPFGSSEEAQAAITAHWQTNAGEEANESLNEATGKGYQYSTCLSFGTDGEADYAEVDVTISYDVVWGSEESGRFSGPPENYDPGSPDEIESIAVLEIDGRPATSASRHTLDAVLSEFEIGKFDEQLIQNAIDIEERRRPDDRRDRDYDDRLEEDAVQYDSKYDSATGKYEIFNVATGEVVDTAYSGHEVHNIIYALKRAKPMQEGDDWRARESRYGPSMILLPTGQNASLENLDQSYFEPGSYVYVVGKENSSGEFTPRFCISSGELSFDNGENVTVVHDQNRGLTPGRVLEQFSYDDWLNDRETVVQRLASLGISPSRKVPVKVFK